MKRNTWFTALLTAAVLLAAVFAATASADIKSEDLFFRTTNANAATSALPWTLPQGHSYFSDSSVFRQIATATNEDTTMAYPISRFIKKWPNIPVTAAAAVDSMAQPWMILTVASSTSDYSWSGTNALDSIYISAQVSIDGSTWTNVDGTPTREFFAATASPIDGNPCLTAIEQNAGANFATVTLGCAPKLQSKADRLVINQNLCAQPGWVRFLVSTGAGTGQFRLIATYDDGSN
ncbi:MAG: hypothetical protein ACT4PE_05505 [Candidatus Eiseniibacteriota bacterium]